MSHRKQGLRTLGVSLLATFGLMAFMSSGAQATKGAVWKILGVTLTTKKAVTVELHTTTVLLVVGGSFNTTFHCTVVKSEGVEVFGEGESTGKLAFSGCTATQGGVAAPKCNPIEQPIVAGVKGLLILDGTETYILFSPTIAGGKLAKFKFGEECTLAPSRDLTGTFVLECGDLKPEKIFIHLDCKNEETSHLLQQAPTTLFPSDVLLFGGKPASLVGIVKVFLTTEPTEKWGGIG